MPVPRRDPPPETCPIPRRPYPTWTTVAGLVGARESLTAQDLQAAKEARLWRDLANEAQGEAFDVAATGRGVGGARR